MYREWTDNGPTMHRHWTDNHPRMTAGVLQYLFVKNEFFCSKRMINLRISKKNSNFARFLCKDV